MLILLSLLLFFFYSNSQFLGTRNSQMFPRSPSEETMSGQKRNVTKLKLVAVLDGHREEITCIKASSEFNVIIR